MAPWPQACHPMPRWKRIDGPGGPTATAIRSWRGLGNSKARQEGAKGGNFPQQIKSANKTHRSRRSRRTLLARKSKRPPRPTELQGARAHGHRHDLDRGLSRSPKATHWRTGMPPRRMAAGPSRCPPEKPLCRQELRHQGFCRRECAALRDRRNVAQNTSRPWWFRHRNGRTAA